MNQVRAAGKVSAQGAPAAGLAAALQALAQGEPVVVLDDADRENEGDLVLAAATATPEQLAFLIRHTSGILCAPMTDERADQLELPLMVTDNTERHRTAFTVSVDLIEGTTTGISAADRCATVRALADPAARPEQFARPGHVFPLRARPGGVLERPGHTEAAVDLAQLAGVPPVMVIGELMTPDGRVAGREEIAQFVAEHGLASVTIAELVAHRRATAGSDQSASADVTEIARAAMPTRYGRFQARLLRSADGAEHLALVRGDLTGEVLVRVHSECHTGDALGSLRCDCGDQLAAALAEIDRAGSGVLLYQFGHEGRGIGLGAKLRAYALQDLGFDTVDANIQLGLPVDGRDFRAVPKVLRALGVERVCLLTNNPDKLAAVRRGGYPDARRRGLPVRWHAENTRYLATKRDRLGHLSDAPQREPALAEVR